MGIVEVAGSIGLLFGGHRPPLQFPGSAGSLAKHNFVGKLPTNTGWQPASLDKIASRVMFRLSIAY